MGLPMEVEVGQVGHSVEEGAAEDLAEAPGVAISHIGQTLKGIITGSNRLVETPGDQI